MRRHIEHGFGGGGVNARTAFSLVEMMIAMVILFFGLLVIGAALPVGLDYSRKTTEASIGEDATNYAMDVIQRRIRSSTATPIVIPGDFLLKGNLFRPRLNDPPNGFPLIPPGAAGYQPVVKVRPLVATNIDASPDAARVGPDLDDDVERIVGVWMAAAGGAVAWVDFNLFVQSAIPSVLRVYPPISSDSPFTAGGFLAGDPRNPNAPRYIRRAIRDANNGGESVKARERLVAWAAFYRRASYASKSDPLLYEVIVVATKRPTVRHRFARQLVDRPDVQLFRDPEPIPLWAGGNRGTEGEDRVAPVPWLVHFSSLPSLGGFYNHDETGNPDRLISAGANEPASLEFKCTLSVGEKLPAGSIFIPAVNDFNNSFPGQADGPGFVGFVPHAPDSLPIYEVTDRIRDDANGEYRIIVKNNGTYPWVDPGVSDGPDAWPVWIIPPAVKPESGQNNSLQVFETRSPIIGVARRYIRFPEVP